VKCKIELNKAGLNKGLNKNVTPYAPGKYDGTQGGTHRNRIVRAEGVRAISDKVTVMILCQRVTVNYRRGAG